MLLGKIQARSEKIIIFQDKVEETIFTQKNWNLFLELMVQKIEIRHHHSPLEIGISKPTLKGIFQIEGSKIVVNSNNEDEYFDPDLGLTYTDNFDEYDVPDKEVSQELLQDEE